VEIVTFAEIQKVKSSFEFKNSISSTRNCNEFRFFEPRFTSLFLTVNMNKEAQLSQRGRAMLRVLKILPSHSISFKFISKLHRREVCVDGLTSYPLYT